MKQKFSMVVVNSTTCHAKFGLLNRFWGASQTKQWHSQLCAHKRDPSAFELLIRGKYNGSKTCMLFVRLSVGKGFFESTEKNAPHYQGKLCLFSQLLGTFLSNTKQE